jgi:hypothetical protein
MTYVIFIYIYIVRGVVILEIPRSTKKYVCSLFNYKVARSFIF